MAPVFGLGSLGRRLVESVVSLFAVLGFIYVPLGRHTGFEHAEAVFSTPAAAAAIDDLGNTAHGLRQRALDFFTGRFGAPRADAESTARPKRHTDARQPRPIPPKLK